MSGEIPLGKKEDLHLEFKGADALKDPEKIAREVVAMLNAEGGEVWVGLGEGEEEGRAVTVEPIPDAERESRRLHDYLVDVIEPPPGPKESVLSVKQGEEGGSLLRIAVAPIPERRPYAFLRKGGRHFVIRTGERMRPMSREEIRKAFDSARPNPDEVNRVEEALRVELEVLQNEAGRNPNGAFWLRIMPAPQFSLNLDALQNSDLLVDPSASGNRRTGQTFFAYGPAGGRPRLEADRLVIGERSAVALTIYRHDGIELRAPLQRFHAGNEPGAEKPLYWMALMEMPISVFRLLSKMVSIEEFWEEPLAPDTQFVSSVALLGLDGWTLRPFSPQLPQLDGWGNYLLKNPRPSSVRDLIPAKPLRFPTSEVRDHPDRCGFRLVRRIYEAFGFGTAEMPHEFDQNTGRLVLPE
jgi:hypothetical protein